MTMTKTVLMIIMMIIMMMMMTILKNFPDLQHPRYNLLYHLPSLCHCVSVYVLDGALNVISLSLSQCVNYNVFNRAWLWLDMNLLSEIERIEGGGRNRRVVITKVNR